MSLSRTEIALMCLCYPVVFRFPNALIWKISNSTFCAVQPMMKGDAVPVENRKEQDLTQHVLVQLSNNLFSV